MGNVIAKTEKTPTQEVLAGKTVGTWTLNEPIKGFKKIHCRCEQPHEEMKQTIKFIASVTIPQGARVTRAYKYSDRTDQENKKPTTKLRADNMKVDSIKPYVLNQNILFNFWKEYSHCKPIQCYSDHTSIFRYEEGQNHKPDKFNDKVTDECTNGLYFFVKEKDAFDY